MIVICGRTCAGKDTLGKWLEERHGFEKVISYTTRPPREGEVDNKDYYFVTGAMFNTMRSNGDFAETTDYTQENGDTWSYGTHRNSYRECKDKKKKYVILNPEGIYQLVNRGIHFDLFYLDNKNKEALERRYRNREYADTHFQPWIDKKFETRWRQDEKDFNAFDEWLKKSKTEEGLPIQIESICRISLNDKNRVSGITRKLRDLGYIDNLKENDILDEYSKKVKECEELKEQLNDVYGVRNTLNECLNKANEDRHKLEEQNKTLVCEIEYLKNELVKTRALQDRNIVELCKEKDHLNQIIDSMEERNKELDLKLRQAEMLRDYYKGLKEEVVEIDRELHKEYDKLADKYLSHKTRNAKAYDELKESYNELLKRYELRKVAHERNLIDYRKLKDENEDLKGRLMQAHGIIDKHREQYKQHDKITFENDKFKRENDILKKQDDQLLMVLAMTVSYLENKEDPKNER